MVEDKGKEVEEDQDSEEESKKTDDVQEVRRFDPEATAQGTNTDRDDGDDNYSNDNGNSGKNENAIDVTGCIHNDMMVKKFAVHTDMMRKSVRLETVSDSTSFISISCISGSRTAL